MKRQLRVAMRSMHSSRPPSAATIIGSREVLAHGRFRTRFGSQWYLRGISWYLREMSHRRLYTNEEEIAQSCDVVYAFIKTSECSNNNWVGRSARTRAFQDAVQQSVVFAGDLVVFAGNVVQKAMH